MPPDSGGILRGCPLLGGAICPNVVSRVGLRLCHSQTFGRCPFGPVLSPSFPFCQVLPPFDISSLSTLYAPCQLCLVNFVCSLSTLPLDEVRAHVRVEERHLQGYLAHKKQCPATCRGTSVIRNSAPLGPYSRKTPNQSSQ